MAKSLIVLALLALFCACRTVLACTTCTQYYYINGVSEAAASLTGPSGSINASKILELRLKNTETYQSNSNVIPLKNPSQGLWSDIFEKLVTQKALEKNLSFGQALQNEVRYSDGDPSYTPSSDDAPLFQQAVGQLLTEQESTEYANVIAPTLDADYATVLGVMQQGTPVTIVAHSEGNMFANEIWSKLALSTQSVNSPFDNPPGFTGWLEIDNIATPASYAPSGFYGTQVEDKVINWLSNLLDAITGSLPALPANWQFTDPLKYDALGHGFISVYLNPAVDTQNLLPNLVAQSNASLQGPTPLVELDYLTSAYGGGLVMQKPDGAYIDVANTSPYGSLSYLYASDIEQGTYKLYTTMSATESLEISQKRVALTVGFLSPDPGAMTVIANNQQTGYQSYPAAPPGQLIPLGSFTVNQNAQGVYAFQATMD